MPLKLHIATSRKIGEPNYGSRGATVGLEMEVDSSLIHQPQQLHQQIARLFRMAKASVDRELQTCAATSATTNSNGSSATARPVTPAQLRAIHAIANRHSVDLVEILEDRFGLQQADDLTIDEASQLIDTLKTTGNGVEIHSE